MSNLFNHRKNKPILWQPGQMLLLLLVFVFAGVVAQGQRLIPNSVYVKAEQYFQDRKYFEAAQLYEKYLSDEKNAKGASDPFSARKKGKEVEIEVQVARQEATFNLAESYRLTHDFTQAEKWYAEAMKLPEHNPVTEYWYGVALRTNEKYDQAEEVITTFLDTYRPDDEWKENAKKELDNLKFIKEEIAKKPGSVVLQAETNERHKSAYALVLPDKKTFAFTSIYIDSSAMKKGKFAYYARLYSSVPGATIMDSAQILPIQSPQGFHEGLATFTRDGQSMVFTRWADKDGARVSALFRAYKTDKGWSKPEKMGAPFNVEGANSTQPFITRDQKYVIFSSNRPGGFGKYDIWYAPLRDSVAPSKAINMGNTINTSEDDMSPFYHPQSNKLVFSSNGRTGMGGFDIYSTTGDFTTLQWEQVVNAGIPINSSKDDLYFISTDDNNLWQNGWLSSDRNSDCCLEIFAFNQLSSQLFAGVVIDKVSRHPIPGAIITLKDLATGSNDPSPVAIADSNGRYHFNLVNTKNVEVKAGKAGYDSVTASYTIEGKPGLDSTVADTIMLTATRLYDPDVVRTGTDPPEPEKTGKQYAPPAEDDPGEEYDPDAEALIGTMNNQLIHFDFDEAIIQEKYFSFLDSVIDIMNMYPSLKIQIGGHTDAFGTPSYNDRLGQDRTEACIRYLVNGGIPANRLSGTSFGATAPIAQETIYGKDNTLGRQMNRRVELRFVEPQTKVAATTKRSSGSQIVQVPTAIVQEALIPAHSESGITAVEGTNEFSIIVHYSFDKAVIDNSYYRSLDTLAEMMQASPSMKLMVNGHTDTRGSDEYNLQLADARVKSCIRYLVKKGIAKDRLTGNAYGECCPIAQETVNGKDDPQARWMNRRVQFSWLKE